ncbi:MAG: uroporphyrinogen-III synthase [Ferruginibacter sp.]|nr:uroporphyrinogen-III synthase [Ferruginibacter sp.]
MVKDTESSAITTTKKVKRILIAQAQPEGSKSPYTEIAKKYDIQIDYCPFIIIEGVIAKDFRKQKIDITSFSAVIFTSRHAIDHFFRVCDEMKISVSQDTKYFCVSEAVALYLQKFILYRKRKVFYGADGTNKSLFEVMNKHKENEKFIYPCSPSFDSEITNWLKNNNCGYATPVLYCIKSNNIKKELASKYDIVCVFTPAGVKALLENSTIFKLKKMRLAFFGVNTFKAAEDAGLELHIKAPMPQTPGMASALEKYLQPLYANKK